VVEIALLYFTVLGAPYLVREKGHVAVDSFVKMAPGLLRRAMPRVVLVVSVAACLVIAGVSAILLAETIESGELVIGGITLPFWAYVLPLPVGYGLVATEFLRLAIAGDTPWADGIGESL
jgi:C4-dicarboxylate transporter, DctQ subunit